jgi:hypothetical protein
MHVNSRHFIPVLLLVVLGVISCPQSESGSSSPRAGEAQTVSVGTGGAEALVIFTSGDVTVRGSGDWTPLRIGVRVGRSQSVRTGAKSACELQFGNTGAVRLESTTEITLEEVALRMEGNRVDVFASAGSVLCKVHKLSGTDRFRVKTRTAICGVRGTEFGVTVNAAGGTVLAVREGRVAVATAAFDPFSPPAELQGEDAATRAALEKLSGAERLVGAAQTVTVSAANLALSEKIVKTATAAAAKMQKAGDNSRFTRAVDKSASDLRRNMAAPGPQGTGQKELLKRIDGLNQRMIKDLPINDAGNENEAAPEMKYYGVGIIAQPRDAEIYLGNEWLGVGRFEGLFSEGVALTFTVRKPGWSPGELSLIVGPDTAHMYELAVNEPDVFTETFINPSVAGSFDSRTVSGNVIEVSLGKQRTLLAPGKLGLEFFPNSATVLVSRQPFRLLLSVWDDTYLLEGAGMENFYRAEPALTRGKKGSFDNGRVSIGGVYRDKDNKLYAFYHAWDSEGFEKEVRNSSETNSMWYSRIAVAVSEDNGSTWNKRGPVIESTKPKEWRSYDGQTTRGVAEACVVPDKSGRYLYLYYTEYARADGRQVDICLARADLTAGPPLPGAFKKYHNRTFGENGQGGLETPVFSAVHLDQADTSLPSVFYSKTLNQYVMVCVINYWKEVVFTRELDKCGLYLAYSEDGIAWSKPSRLVKDFPFPMDGKTASYAPSVILDAGSDTEGWLVYAYSPKFGGRDKKLVPTHLAGRRISFKKK